MPVKLTADPGDAPLQQAATPGEFAAAFRLSPREAVAYMQGRDRVRISYDWTELWQDEHARAFTVSRLTRADLLDALRQGIERSVGGELTRRDWLRDAKALLKDAGWWGEKRVIGPDGGERVTVFNPRRLELIYDVNTRMSYAAGRWERIQAAKQSHPYLRYVTRNDERVRASHRAWHNVTLPIDDPWWSTHYPPNGWRCRCTAVQLRAREVDGNPNLKRQAPVEPPVEWKNPRTGEVVAVPANIDPGFAYNVGEAAMRWRGLIDAARQKITQYPARLGAAQAEDLAPLIERDWARWVEEAIAGRERNRLGWLGVIAPTDLAHLAARGIEPISAEVMVRPGLLYGPKAKRHLDAGNAFTADQWRALPGLFRRAVAVLLDTRSGKVIYLLPGADGRLPQMAVEVDFVTKRPRRTTNAAVSGYLVDPADIRNRIGNGEIEVVAGAVAW